MKAYSSIIKELTNITNSNALVKNSFNSIKINSQNLISSIIIIAMGVFLSVWISSNADTSSKVEEISNFLFEIQLTILGCVLAVYSILLAFFSDTFIKKLASVSANESPENLLMSYIKYYENMLSLNFVAICASGIYFIGSKLIPNEYMLFSKNYINEILSIFLLSPYVVYEIRIIYELKSLIFNTVALFRFSFAYRFKYFEEENNKKINDTDKT